MCRNIKTLFNFEPPATELEIRDASLQFVRKLSGFNIPSKTNEAAFDQAVADIAASARALMASLKTTAQARNREVEAQRARERAALRFPKKSIVSRSAVNPTRGANPNRFQSPDYFTFSHRPPQKVRLRVFPENAAQRVRGRVVPQPLGCGLAPWF